MMNTSFQSRGTRPQSLVRFAAALLTGLAATVAWAGSAPDDVRSVIVRYDELDLSQPAGAEVLYKRIQRAARQVCPEPTARSQYLEHAGECYKDAVARAVAQVNNPQLSAIHGAHLALASR